MKRSETKLLVENWRKFVSNPAEFERKNRDVLSSNILIENRSRNTYFDGSFNGALNEVKTGRMPAEVLLEQVVTDFQNQMILNESAWEAVKEFTQSGAKKLTDSVKSAFAKINKMYEDVTLKVWNIITLGKVKLDPVKKAVDKILSKVGELQESNPTMFKIMIYVSMVVVISAVIVMTTKQASAELTGVKPLQGKVAMGLLKQYFKQLDAFDFENHQKVFDCIVQLKKLLASGDQVDPKELNGMLQLVINKADKLIQLGRESGEGSYDYQWVGELLKSAKAKIILNGQSVQ